jgi:hypothetical protein
MDYVNYHRKIYKRLGHDFDVISASNMMIDKHIYLKRWKHFMQQKGGMKNKSKILIDDDQQSKIIKYKYNEKFCTIFEDIEGENVTYSLPLLVSLLALYRKDNEGGSLLLNLMLDFIKKYLKPLYDLKYVQLRDISHLWCKKFKTNIDVDSFYMLTHGNTWQK